MTDPAHSLPNDDRIAPESQASGNAPDWRVSADEGAESERTAIRPPEMKRDHLRLATSNDLSTSLPMERPIAPVSGARPAAAPGQSAGPKAWTAAASSVPKLKVELPPAPSDEDAAGFAAPRPARAMPAPKRAPAMVAESQDGDALLEDDDSDGFLGAGIPGKAPAAVAVPKLDEPFWVVVLDELRSNTRVQMMVTAVVAAAAITYAVWPKGDPGVSLHDLKANAARYDNASVTVKGRVGEVFRVGGGYAFNLHQGRDTIVVFTHGAPPRMRDKIAISGSVSTGYLDGLPRQAIFATPTP